jgi:aminoglycoside 3-N-acetyltransferase
MESSSFRDAVTEERLCRDFEAIGISRGTTLIVHSSLSAMGWVLGGAPGVIRALLRTLGDEGNLAMPAATPQCANLPLFDVRTTPTTMGAIPETFRTWPGTLRSDHPLESVCVRGPDAAAVIRDHPLAFSEGPGSPFARLHDIDSFILLLGVTFNRCTALHFAESLVPNRRTASVRFPRPDAGGCVWVEVPNVADDNDTHFPVIGAQYMDSGAARVGPIGEAKAIYFRMRDLVEFARSYFEAANSRPATSAHR